MKKYIKENFEKIAVGFAVAIFYIATLSTVSDVIIKIALILDK